MRVLLAALAVAAPVVGGTQAPDGAWPDAVAVMGNHGTCSGTLVAPDVVLTAGHCVDIEPTRVVVGASYAQGQSIAVVEAIAAPRWQETYDVAALVLAEPVVGVEPRALAASCTFERFARGTMVHLVGFGLTDASGTGANSVLREAMAPVDDPACSGGGGCRPAIAPGGEFIAGDGSAGSCFGDSGGPVYLDTDRGTIAIGTVSRGVDGATQPCGAGAIYVRTDRIADWLEEATGRAITRDTCSPAPASSGCNSSGSEKGLCVAVVFLFLVRTVRPKHGRRSRTPDATRS